MILLAYVYRVAKLKRRAEKEVASWLKAMLIFYLPLRSTGICASILKVNYGLTRK
jgi:hypothetical protein